MAEGPVRAARVDRVDGVVPGLVTVGVALRIGLHPEAWARPGPERADVTAPAGADRAAIHLERPRRRSPCGVPDCGLIAARIAFGRIVRETCAGADGARAGRQSHAPGRAGALAERRRGVLPGAPAPRGPVLPRATVQRPARAAGPRARPARHHGAHRLRGPRGRCGDGVPGVGADRPRGDGGAHLLLGPLLDRPGADPRLGDRGAEARLPARVVAAGTSSAPSASPSPRPAATRAR